MRDKTVLRLGFLAGNPLHTNKHPRELQVEQTHGDRFLRQSARVMGQKSASRTSPVVSPDPVSGYSHDGGCPNLCKASQNRAMRGIRHPGVLE